MLVGKKSITLVGGPPMKTFPLIAIAAILTLVTPNVAFGLNDAQKHGGASIFIALAAGFLILLCSIIIILSLLVRQAQPLFRFAGSVLRSIKQALAENPDIKNLIEHHPRISRHLAHRFDRDHFSGLTLTFISLCFLFTL